MYINYEYYRVFYYAAKCGNLTKAAALLQNSQPNLTRAIKTLEAELGCTLFSRTNRGLILTPEGEALYRHIRVAFAEIEAGEAAVTQSRTLERGSVFLAASEGALRCLLLPVLREFRAHHPGVHLRISNHSTPQAVAALHETTADFAVVTTPAALLPSLTQTRVRPIQEVPVCAPEFSVLLDRTVTLADLAAHPLITLGAGTTSHDFYAAVFARRGVPFQPVIEAATADQIIPMAEAGLGVGIVPQDFIRTSDRVRTIELDEPLPPRAVCIVKRKGHPLSVAARELERMLLAAGAEHCACGEVRRVDFGTQ